MHYTFVCTKEQAHYKACHIHMWFLNIPFQICCYTNLGFSLGFPLDLSVAVGIYSFNHKSFTELRHPSWILLCTQKHCDAGRIWSSQVPMKRNCNDSAYKAILYCTSVLFQISGLEKPHKWNDPVSAYFWTMWLANSWFTRLRVFGRWEETGMSSEVRSTNDK